jgi:hypothetical protein
MYINITNLQSNGVSTDSNNPNFTYYVPCNSASGGLVEYKCNSYFDQVATVDKPFISQFNVQLQGVGNSTVNLNGSEWEMILQSC